MLVDGVELRLLDQPEEMRELHRDHAARREQDPHAFDEVVQRGHVREHVVAYDQVGLPPLAREPGRRLASEELDERRDPSLLGHLGHVGRRLDPEHRDTGLHEPLEEVAVVARDLDDRALGAEAEARNRRLDVGLRVPHPALRDRGEVDVVREDVLGRLDLLKLDEEAPVADVRVQRQERLPLAQLRFA